MAAPTLSHLDPLMTAILDDVRERLTRLFRRAEGSFAFAVSGTGTAGMEAAVANLVSLARASLVDRVWIFRRSARADVRALRRDGDARRRRMGPRVRSRGARTALAGRAVDIVAMVHAETSTGVLNPVREAGRDRARAWRAGARRRGDLVRRPSARHRRLGHRRLLQLHAEVPRRAGGSRAGGVRPRRSSGV